MNIPEYVELFLEVLLADGVSAATLRWYRSRLGALVGFLGAVPVEGITTNDLRRFLISLRGRKELYQDHHYHAIIAGSLSAATQQSYVRAIKRFFKWLEGEGCLEHNAARGIKVPRLPRQVPKAITPEDFRTLLGVTEGDDPALRRDRALILFLADTGCRVAGAVGLRRVDLQLFERLAMVTEKGNRSRLVMFTEVTRAALQGWLAMCPVVSEWVFPSFTTGGKLHPTTVNHILAGLKAKAGIQGRCNPHAFRHAFAREYILSGGDLATLSEILGHQDVMVTKQFYSVFLLKELQEKHDRYSPVARLPLGDRGTDEKDRLG